MGVDDRVGDAVGTAAAARQRFLTARDVLGRDRVPPDFVVEYGSDPNQFGHLRVLAGRHELDLDRVVVAGHSSGGHLALWAVARHRIPESSPLYGMDPLPIAGAVSLAGPGALDPFREIDQEVCGGDVIDLLLGGSPEEVPSRYEAAVPGRMLPLGTPQRLLTGAHDGIVPARFAEAYAEAAREAGDDALSIVLEGAAHFEPIVPESEAFPRVRETILALLEPRDRAGVRRREP